MDSGENYVCSDEAEEQRMTWNHTGWIRVSVESNTVWEG